MTRNIVVFVMSPYNPRPTTYRYDDGSGLFSFTCYLSNEPALRCIAHGCGKIDHYFALVSDQVQADYDQILSCFEKSPELISVRERITPVPLGDEGTLQGTLPSISKLFDTIQEYIRQNPQDRVRVHLDLTGGFRHTSMMMLPLIRLLQYSGIQLGRILYANFFTDPPVVEDASELMDMFSLVGGADDFVSFGNVSQLRRYFSREDQVSDELKRLLDHMDAVADTIRICVNYPAMNLILRRVSQSLKQYQAFIATGPVISHQEVFFSKLLEKIQAEYQSILPDQYKNVSPVAIIAWCIHKGFLQQATTFYTEWLPPYIVREGFIDYIQEDIIEACKKEGKTFSSWENYLFRSYIPAVESPVRFQEHISMQEYVKQCYQNRWGVKRFLGSLNEEDEKLKDFIAFVKQVQIVTACVPPSRLLNYIFALPTDNPLRRVLEKSVPSGIVRIPYLKKRLNKVYSADWMIIESVTRMSKADFNDVFHIVKDTPKAVQNQQSAIDRSIARRGVFESLLRHKKISIQMSEGDFLNFIEMYSNNVTMLRNRFNHASADIMSEDEDFQIGQRLMNSLSLLRKR